MKISAIEAMIRKQHDLKKEDRVEVVFRCCEGYTPIVYHYYVYINDKAPIKIIVCIA